MSDRELLELAAKAAGLGGRWIDYDQTKWLNKSGYYLEPHVHWNPLTDDGDALRLAVTLEIGVMSKSKRDLSELDTTVAITPFDVSQKRITEKHKGNPAAATRRAIVRAAAEIGRSLP